MPAKMNMFLSNGNKVPSGSALRANPSAGFNINQTKVAEKPSSSLNAPIITRIHNVKAGCGSCGR